MKTNISVLVQACTFLHGKQSVWARMQPAPAKPHRTCGLHHRHGRDMVYSVTSARGMCSQPGPLGAPIIQVTKGSPCTRNTRALLVSKPKPSQSFQHQHTKLEKTAVTVLLKHLHLSSPLHLAGFPHIVRYWVSVVAC